MSKKIYIFVIILFLIWLLSMIYLIINEEWLALIKSLLIFMMSYFAGRICSYFFFW